MRFSFKSILSLISVLSVLIFFVNTPGCKLDNDVNNNSSSSSEQVSSSESSSESSAPKEDPRIFKITKEMSESQLRDHIRGLFQNIEDRIQEGDYEGWFSSLSKSYQDYVSDPYVLSMSSAESEYFRENGIVLKTAEDYFRYVVILSREGRKLEFFDYEVITSKTIVVICLDEGAVRYEYKFLLEDGVWKLSR